MLDNTKGFFDSTVDMFNTYRKTVKKLEPNLFSTRLGQEVAKRLKQLSFICNKIRYYENLINKNYIQPILSKGQRNLLSPLTESHAWNFLSDPEYQAALFEMEFFVESFYFFADRIRSILSHKKNNILPGLQKFDAKGVCEIRNHFLQHPEKHGMLTIQSFCTGDEDGPRVKIARTSGEDLPPQDPGLWINAKEFKINLEILLQDAVDKAKK